MILPTVGPGVKQFPTELQVLADIQGLQLTSSPAEMTAAKPAAYEPVRMHILLA